jgi:predicted DCC family thiol-disulfide oxidoreductase YuxK
MNEKITLPVLIFDDECLLCKRFAQGLKRLPGSGRLNFCSIHDEEIYQNHADLDRARCHDTVHLIDETGQIHKGHEVIKYLVKFYPGVSRLGWLLETRAGDKATQMFYKTMNDMRARLSKGCTNCDK